MIELLVIHQNFPGQFGHLVEAWSRRPGWDVRGLGRDTAPGLRGFEKLTRYSIARQIRPDQHLYLRQMEASTPHGQPAARAMLTMKQGGFTPDVILGGLKVKGAQVEARAGSPVQAKDGAVRFAFHTKRHRAEVSSGGKSSAAFKSAERNTAMCLLSKGTRTFTPLMPVDPTAFMRLAEACMAARDEVAFRVLVREFVRPLLPHALLLAVVGRLDLEHLRINSIVFVDYPPSADEIISRTVNLRERPIVRRWMRTREPIVVELPRDADAVSQRERNEIETLELGRLAIHGVLDLSSRAGTYFSFGGVPAELDESELMDRLRLLVPLLHMGLVNVTGHDPSSKSSALRDLSKTEVELLHWVAAGRSNKEIASLRDRSIATVRNQLHSVFVKLGVSSRGEAIRLLMGDSSPHGLHDA